MDTMNPLVLEDFEEGDRAYVVREWEVFLGTVTGVSDGKLTLLMDAGNQEVFSKQEILSRPQGVNGLGKPLDLSTLEKGMVITMHSGQATPATVLEFIPQQELVFQFNGYDPIRRYKAVRTIREMGRGQSIEQQMVLWQSEG